MKKLLQKIKRGFKKVFIIAYREYKETKEMAYIYIHQRSNKERLREANKQLIDIFKIIFLIPITILPGSVIIVTILELIAKAFKTTIFPKKQRF